MLVLKFGGTSVGLPSRMKKIADLVLHTQGQKIIVLSALSGTTNSLVTIGDNLLNGEVNKAEDEISTLEKHYNSFVSELFDTEGFKAIGNEVISRYFILIRLLAAGDFDSKSYRELLAQGELLSTELFYQHLQERKINSRLLPALHFMTIDENEEPELEKISLRLKPFLKSLASVNVIVTQGYICRNHKNEIDNLKRGGSDYTASLIGAAVGADEIQIWTDIDGMHNNDPRIVKKTFPISHLTFDEASELAYFGAKILHPSTIVPAQKYKIPVRLKNTMDENAAGTIISHEGESGIVKAIAAKDGITAIKIKSSRMLLAFGFLRKIFEVFEKYRTPIDMISTSEVAVSVTIDDDSRLKQIVNELHSFGTVEVDKNQSIICVVGNRLTENKEMLQQVFTSLRAIPIRMVSYGGSYNNISLLIDSIHKESALKSLNQGLFNLR
ncbi:MAG: aspartate kinase [Flammeovirgaceae bacterium]|nr:aspartate kinase [Flammeovirgaceae bacterium]